MSAYYNEHDKHAAAWLRELINAGEIAPGEVDERSITEVRAGDLVGFTQWHFFAGIGGWSRALRIAGVPDDSRDCTASLPCQPFSASGKQEGASDDRHLWPVFFDLARECGFERIFGEQVARAIGFNWLDGISADLEAARYTVGSIVLGAHSVGAPHRRQRLYWVADGERSGLEGHAGNGDHGHEPGRERADAAGSTAESGGAGRMVDTDGRDASAEWEQRIGEQRQQSQDGGTCNGGMDDTAGTRREPERQWAEGEARDEARMRGPEHGRAVGPWDNFTIIPCRDGKYRRIPRKTQPGFQPVADGLPEELAHLRDASNDRFPLTTRKIEGRAPLLKGAGNAIVPELAAQFILACEEALNT